MSRKDYIIIADALCDAYREEYRFNDEEVGYSLFRRIVNTMATELKRDNYKFNVDKFIDYVEHNL